MYMVNIFLITGGQIKSLVGLTCTKKVENQKKGANLTQVTLGSSYKLNCSYKLNFDTINAFGTTITMLQYLWHFWPSSDNLFFNTFNIFINRVSRHAGIDTRHCQNIDTLSEYWYFA